MKVKSLLIVFAVIFAAVSVCKAYAEEEKAAARFKIVINREQLNQLNEEMKEESKTGSGKHGCFIGDAWANEEITEEATRDLVTIESVIVIIDSWEMDNAIAVILSESEEGTYTGGCLDLPTDSVKFTGRAITSSGDIFEGRIDTSLKPGKVAEIVMFLSLVEEEDIKLASSVTIMTDQSKFLPFEEAPIKVFVDNDYWTTCRFYTDSSDSTLSIEEEISLGLFWCETAITLTPPRVSDDIWGRKEAVTVEVEDESSDIVTASIDIDFSPRINRWLLTGEDSGSGEKIDLTVKEFDIAVESGNGFRYRDSDDSFEDPVVLIDLQSALASFEIRKGIEIDERTMTKIREMEIDTLKSSAIENLNMKDLSITVGKDLLGAIPGTAGAVISTAKTIVIDCKDIFQTENDDLRMLKGIAALISLSPYAMVAAPAQWVIDRDLQDILDECAVDDLSMKNFYSLGDKNEIFAGLMKDVTIQELGSNSELISTQYYETFNYNQWKNQQAILQNGYQSELTEVPFLATDNTTVYFSKGNYQSLLPRSIDILDYQQLWNSDFDAFDIYTPSVIDQTVFHPNIFSPPSSITDIYTPISSSSYSSPVLAYDPYSPSVISSPNSGLNIDLNWSLDYDYTPSSIPTYTTPTFPSPSIPTYTPPIYTPFPPIFTPPIYVPPSLDDWNR